MALTTNRSFLDLPRELRAKAAQAWLALFWERLWPLLVPVLSLAGLFVALSWFGLWRHVSDPVRIGLLIAFAIALAAALAAALFALAHLALPGEVEALHRVEQVSALQHRPASGLRDTLSPVAQDAGAMALWTAHRKRLLAQMSGLRAGLPKPDLIKSDANGLRFAVPVMLALAAFVASGEHLVRLGEAFTPATTRMAAAGARIDAWIDPPAYTRQAPVFLTGANLLARPDGVEVPAGSELVVRVHGLGRAALSLSDAPGSGAGVGVAASEPARENVSEFRARLTRSTVATLRDGPSQIAAWTFAVIADKAPTITLVGDPQPARSGALELNYSVQDDYGVVWAEARIERADAGEPGAAGARPLVGAPSFPLSLPRLRVRQGKQETIKDLTAHPWAGTRVRLRLAARDGAGQEGLSAAHELVLPARQFVNPVARTLAEQRRELLMDAHQAGRVAHVLDGLTLAPERHLSRAGDHLALRSAYHRLVNARDDEALLEVADDLWAIALRLEDGDLSLAAQALRTAQEALRRALEDGASGADIRQLTEALREATQRYHEAAMEARPEGQKLGPQDLERMLDGIEQLAESGAYDPARELLNQQQRTMENLQTGRMQPMQQGRSPMGEALDQLGEMMRRQLQLMNETFRLARQPGHSPVSRERVEELLRDRWENLPGSELWGGQRPGPFTEEQIQETLRRFSENQQNRQEILRRLEDGQKQLQQALRQPMEQLEAMGMRPGEDLGQAVRSMGRATGELGESLPGAAFADQEEALEALRQGAQSLARQMANQMQPGSMDGGLRRGLYKFDEDPLGRPLGKKGPGFGTQVKVPDEIDAQRAREILEMIRDRLNDPARPLIERNYLERLINRF